MNACAHGSKGWLRTQLVSMVVVGVLTGVSLLGNRSALPRSSGCSRAWLSSCPSSGPSFRRFRTLLL